MSVALTNEWPSVSSLLDIPSCVLVIRGAVLLGVSLAVLLIYFTTPNSLLDSKGFIMAIFSLYLLHSLNLVFGFYLLLLLLFCF